MINEQPLTVTIDGKLVNLGLDSSEPLVRDDDASLIPDAGEVATVQAYIDSLRPVTASVTVVAPTAAIARPGWPKARSRSTPTKATASSSTAATSCVLSPAPSSKSRRRW